MRKSGASRTFPKENEKRLKEQIKDLKAQIIGLEKENRILKEELLNLFKPVRKRNPHKEEPKLTQEIWRKRFLDEIKESVQKRQDAAGIKINFDKLNAPVKKS